MKTSKPMSTGRRAKTIAEYISLAPKVSQKRLRDIHKAIKASAPGATEGLKWGMPSYSYKRILVNFAVFKHHIGFYPTPRGVKEFEKDLAKYKTGRGSIQFPFDRPLPLPLIRKVIKFRVKEAQLKDKKWRS